MSRLLTLSLKKCDPSKGLATGVIDVTSVKNCYLTYLKARGYKDSIFDITLEELSLLDEIYIGPLNGLIKKDYGILLMDIEITHLDPI